MVFKLDKSRATSALLTGTLRGIEEFYSRPMIILKFFMVGHPYYQGQEGGLLGLNIQFYLDKQLSSKIKSLLGCVELSQPVMLS